MMILHTRRHVMRWRSFMLLGWRRPMRRRRVLLVLRWWQAVRHTIRRRVAMMCRFHVVRWRLRMRRVRRRGRRVCTRMRRRGGSALLMRRVVGVGAIHRCWRGMSRAVVMAVSLVLLPLAWGFMRLVRRQTEGRKVVLGVGGRRRLRVRRLDGWQRGARRLLMRRRRELLLLRLLMLMLVVRRRWLRRRRAVGVLVLWRDGRRCLLLVIRRRGRAVIDGGVRRLLLLLGWVLRIGRRRRRRRSVWGSPRVHDDAGCSPCGQGEESRSGLTGLQAVAGPAGAGVAMVALVRRGREQHGAKRRCGRGWDWSAAAACMA